MILALLAVLTAPTSPAVASAQAGDPPIRISLNSSGSYDRGDRAKVRVHLAEDGYLVVLRADADGRVRVLFPLDPGDDDFMRGGRDYELPGRGGRETFFVDDRSGAGTILAARSDVPFQYDHFMRGDHWDYRVLTSDRMQDDPEAGLLDLVDAMADSTHFDYDVVGYSVNGAERYTYRHYGYGPGFHIGIGNYYGSRYRCGYYDPFYDPFNCDPLFYDPFYYSPVYYQPYGYSCYADPFCFGYGRHYGYGYGRPGRGNGGFSFKRPTPPPPFVLPRRRLPTTPIAFGTRTPLVTTGTDPDRRPPVVVPRRRESPPPAARPKSSEGSGRSWSGGERSSGHATPRASNPRPSTPRPSTPRPSTPSRSSGSKPSNSSGRRH